MRRRGDRIRGRRGYGGVVLVPCLLHDAYRYWLSADTVAARTLITPDVALELDLDVQTPVRQERIASVHRVVAAPVVRLATLQIGAQRLTNVEASCCHCLRNCMWMAYWESMSWNIFGRPLSFLRPPLCCTECPP